MAADHVVSFPLVTDFTSMYDDDFDALMHSVKQLGRTGTSCQYNM
jgi:hypothetical protein